MNTCSARRGFLSISNCDAPGARNCAACGRMMCPDHLSPASGFQKCLECANGKQREPLPDKPKVNDADESYRYRDSYYSDRDYDPLPYAFLASDRRGFDRDDSTDIWADDDEPRSSFGDS